MNNSTLPLCLGLGIGLGLAGLYSWSQKKQQYHAIFGSLVTLKVNGFVTITVDDQTFVGNNIIIENGMVFIDGKKRATYCKCNLGEKHLHLFNCTIAGYPHRIELLAVYPNEMIKDDLGNLTLNPNKVKIRHDTFIIQDGDIVKETSYQYNNYYNG